MSEWVWVGLVGVGTVAGQVWYVRRLVVREVAREVSIRWAEMMAAGHADLQALKQRRALALLAAQQAEGQQPAVSIGPINGGG